MVRIADHPVHALNGGKWEMIAALDDETEALHKPDLREGGSFLSREMAKEIGAESKKLFGEIRSANTALVGCVLTVIGVTPERMAEAAESGKAEYLKIGV
jgi:Pyruvate/2-oxoacid:ferredoxin oxidoreductase gamma subunit